MMKNNKGFTLVELLISMMLLSFVIILSATLFDRAIQGTPKLRESIVNTSESSSQMEMAILRIKDIYRYYKLPATSQAKEPKPRDFDNVMGETGKRGEPVTVSLGNTISIVHPRGGKTDTANKAKGYFVSIDPANSQNIKYNSANTDDRLYTFVSIGHDVSPTSSVENIYVDSSKRFVYFPKRALNTDIDYEYNIASLNRGNFERLRIRFLKSPHNSENSIYSVYNEGYLSNPHFATLTQDLFDFDRKEYDTKSLSGKAKYDIPSYNLNKQGYLNHIDKSYAATAVTFNINGRVGTSNSTFNNKIANKTNSVYLIGLPIIDNLVSHYDSNLALSASKTDKNEYYSLFDINNKDRTNFSDNLAVVDNETYSFDWKNNDIRNFLGIKTTTTSGINIPKGFFRKDILTDTENKQVEVPNYRKAYGDTVYYKMNDMSNSVKLDFSSDFTFFVKYNPYNYNQNYKNSDKDGVYAHAILSHNVNLQTGVQIDSSKSAFVLYVDHFGKLMLYSVTKQGGAMKSITTDMGIDMNSLNLYKDDSTYKFNRLLYNNKVEGKRDDREGFNIIAITKSNAGFDINFLLRDISSPTIKTSVKKTVVNLSDINYSVGDFYFGTQVDNLMDLNTNTLITHTDASKEPVMEISDMILYQTKFSDDDIKTTMDYLYRKYLTDNEREAGRFDINILSTY